MVLIMVDFNPTTFFHVYLVKQILCFYMKKLA